MAEAALSGVSSAVQLTGARVRRVEDRRYLTGTSQYVADIRLPDTLEVAFVRSPHAHARIVGTDTRAAAAHPGVVAVLTGADARDVIKPIRAEFDLAGYRETDWPALACDTVRFVGEAVAAVVATDRSVAEDAVELLQVAYEPLPVVTSADAAMLPGSQLVHAHLPDNVLLHTSFSSGDVDGAFRDADLVFQRRLRGGRLSPMPLETRGCLASYDPRGEALIVWSSTQAPHLLRTWLADVLRFPEHRVRVVAPDVGGGFGLKLLLQPEEVVTTYLSIALGRPVRWVETRREHLLAAPQARDQAHEIALAFQRDGTLVAIRDRIVCDVGAYSAFPVGLIMEPIVASKSVPGPYKARHYAYDTYGVATNKVPIGAYRGVGRPVANFALEHMLDLAAREMGVDPADLRRRNLVQPDELPFRSATGSVYDSGSYVESLDKALEALDYPALRREQAELRQQGRLLGIGLSCLTEATAPPSVWFQSRGDYAMAGYDVASVGVGPSGKATVAVGASSHGQGHETSFAQLVGDELGLPLRDVVVLHGDTAVSPYGLGTWASRSAVLGGGAAILAARKVREKLLRLASHLLEASVDDLELAEGMARVRGVPGRSIPVEELGRIAHFMPYRLPEGMEPGLEATQHYEAPAATYSNTVHAAVVEIDAETCQVHLKRYVVVEDCGTVINPAIVEGQVHGGAAQGIASSLLEEHRYDEDGQLLTASLMDYAVPTAMDVPSFELFHLETPSPITVGGIKGMGEGGASAPPGAIANAIGDALQTTVTELPVTHEKLYQLLSARLTHA